LTSILVSDRIDGLAWPWKVQVQGLYNYHSVMDVGLVIGYQEQKHYQSLAWDGSPATASYLDSTLSNLDYALSFRVRLPMVREDDLRFGVNL